MIRWRPKAWNTVGSERAYWIETQVEIIEDDGIPKVKSWSLLVSGKAYVQNFCLKTKTKGWFNFVRVNDIGSSKL